MEHKCKECDKRAVVQCEECDGWVCEAHANTYQGMILCDDCEGIIEDLEAYR